MLSHSFRTGITSGYAKGTESSDMVKCIEHLKACAEQVMHPLLLPIIILSHDLSFKNDQKQRDAREWLRKLEHAVSMRDEVLPEESRYVKDSIVDLDQINRDLVECHSQVLWKRPQAYQEIIRTIDDSMRIFWDKAKAIEAYGGSTGEVSKLHRSMESRLEFYQAKLKGIENYAHTTLERLSIQRAAVCSFLPPPSRTTKLTRSPALQRHRPKGIQARPQNGRRATPPRSRCQARQHVHEDALPPRSHLLASDLPRLGLQHDFF
jgi:hypothetical protein